MQEYIGRGPVEFIPSGKTKPRILFLVCSTKKQIMYTYNAMHEMSLKFSQFTDLLLVTSLMISDKYRNRHKLPHKYLLVL